MRLDIGLVHRLGRITPLNDDIGLAEAGGNVALREGYLLGDIGRLFRLRVDPCGEEIVVQHRRIGPHRLLDIDDMRQDLVFDLNQVDSLGGDCR
jgi:hypothetical protein